MIVATFYADCELPRRPAEKAAGFDWHQAIRELEASARKNLNAETFLVTDTRTTVAKPAIRVGDAKAESVILWLLDAQAAAIRAFDGQRLVMASPDALIAGPLDMLFGDWDVCLLTRNSPKFIVNSVVAVKASAKLADKWDQIARDARKLSPDARAWGADLDAVIDAFQIRPSENSVREVDGIRARFMPIDGVFRSVDYRGKVQPLTEPVWDFKGLRKQLMPAYARLLLGNQ